MKHLYAPSRRMASLLLSLCFLQTIFSQPTIGFTSAVTGLVNPVDVVAEPGSNRLFVVQQGGLIRIVNPTTGTILTDPYLDLSSLLNLTGSERGLLSMAFHPDYLDPSNGYVFVYYTNTAGSIELARYQRDALSADSAEWLSGEVMLTITKPAANHNGGKLNFGPDGMLYFATGDGGDSNDPENDAQSNTSLLGKMLRLDVDNFTTPPFYTVPPTNPFTGGSPIDDRVWALGLRNPWRWSFDRDNGDMWIADVGQGSVEEVNHVTPAESATGLNYGWRCREGNITNPAYPGCTPSGGGTLEGPIFVYGHNGTTGGFSITGGYVYRGNDWPELDGYYITADYVSGNAWLVRPDGTFEFQNNLPDNISGFGEDNDGEIYALSRTGGTLYLVVQTNPLPVTLARFNGTRYDGYNQLNWLTASEQNTKKFVVEYSTDGRTYLVAGEVVSTLNSNGDSYSFRHYTNHTGLIRYRLRIEDIDQSSRYSPIISINNKGDRNIKVYPTTVTNGMVQVISDAIIDKLEIYSADGRQVHARNMNGANGYFNLPLPNLQKGIYMLRFYGIDFQKTEKIIIQ